MMLKLINIVIATQIEITKNMTMVNVVIKVDMQTDRHTDGRMTRRRAEWSNGDQSIGGRSPPTRI